jgi:hypothetical protein
MTTAIITISRMAIFADYGEIKGPESVFRKASILFSARKLLILLKGNTPAGL